MKFYFSCGFYRDKLFKQIEASVSKKIPYELSLILQLKVITTLKLCSTAIPSSDRVINVSIRDIT